MSDLALVSSQPSPTQAALALPERAQAIVVKDAASYQVASDFFDSLGKMESKIEAFFKKATSRLDDVKKVILDRKRVRLAPIQQAKTITSDKMKAYREEVRKAEEAERKRREEEERARKAAATQPAATQPAATRPQTPAPRPAPTPAPARPTLPVSASTTTRTFYHWRVVDEAKIPRKFYVLDEKAIGALVTQFKERAVELVPGIEVFTREEIVRKGGRS